MGGSSGSISDDEEVGLVVAEKERDSVFEDSARLEAHGGAGGAGCVSFVRVQTGKCREGVFSRLSRTWPWQWHDAWQLMTADSWAPMGNHHHHLELACSQTP